MDGDMTPGTDDCGTSGEDFPPVFGESENGGGEGECAWQSHVHEILGSTAMAGESSGRHNHRIAGMTGEAIYVPGSHVHRLAASTDFFDHYHTLRVITGPATFLLDRGARKSDRKHVHFVEGFTTNADGHRHAFCFATLVEAPLAAEDAEFRY
jgi:hypothetical protein